MEIILTSFGSSHLPPHRLEKADSFYRMPPLTMSGTYQDVMFDCAVLLLSDSVILDSASWEKLSKTNTLGKYSDIAKIVRSLYDEGFLRIVDFDSIISANRSLLDKMLDRDLRILDTWVEPLKESTEVWRSFVASMDDMFPPKELDDTKEFVNRMAAYSHHYAHHASGVIMKNELLKEALSSSVKRRRKDHRAVLYSTLVEYLSYINANLILSNTLNAPFYDWSDIQPFYREKLLRIGKEELPAEKQITNIKQLFEISFPEFALWDSHNIIRILKDKRIGELRDLVNRSVNGEVSFDREFASRVLIEVLAVERKLGRIRKIISYAAFPLGLVPWIGSLLEKGADELAGIIAEKKVKKPLNWFYLITEVESVKQHTSFDK